MLFMYWYTIQLSGVMNEVHIICGVTRLALSVADVPTLLVITRSYGSAVWQCVPHTSAKKLPT